MRLENTLKKFIFYHNIIPKELKNLFGGIGKRNRFKIYFFFKVLVQVQ